MNLLRGAFFSCLLAGVLLVSPALAGGKGGRIPQPIAGATASMTTRVSAGQVKYYRTGLLTNVARIRRAQGYSIPRLSEEDYMALTGTGSCAHVGEWRYLSIAGGKAERKIVVDCSAGEAAKRHTRDGLIGEVSYSTAYRYGFASRGKAQAALWYGGE
jgi:hypothetical protein